MCNKNKQTFGSSESTLIGVSYKTSHQKAYGDSNLKKSNRQYLQILSTAEFYVNFTNFSLLFIETYANVTENFVMNKVDNC